MKCIVENCQNETRSKGCSYCEKHYYRLRRTGSTNDRVKNYSINENCFDILTPENAWVLGLIWSDGNISSGTSSYINIASKDLEMLQEVERILEAKNTIKPVKSSNCYRLSFTSKYIASKLRELGLHSAKSFTVKWPINFPSYLEWHFLRGLFDGDGWASIGKRNKIRFDGNTIFESISICICTASKELESQVCQFYDKHNISYRSELSKKGIIPGPGKYATYRISVSKNQDVLNLYHFFYDSNGPSLLRKKKIIEEWLNRPKRRIGRPTGIPNPNKISKVTEDSIANDYQFVSKSLNKTAIKFGVSGTTVQNILNKKNIKTYSGRSIYDRLSSSTKEDIIRCRKNGDTFSQLQQKFRIGERVIQRVLKGSQINLSIPSSTMRSNLPNVVE